MKQNSINSRWVISAFILLNLGTVLFMNAPPGVSRSFDQKIHAAVSPAAASPLRYFGRLIRRYARLVGLGNRWQMFSRNSRFNWWYVIKAVYADGTTRVLPLPRQSRRSVLERELFDFKEAKFHLNISRNPAAREAYARYLCRQYPNYNSSPAVSIVWEVHRQMILEPKEAARRGTHLEPDSDTRILHLFACPPDGTLT